MISCRRARALLVENVREAAGEVTLLQLDQHLAACGDCRHERARWETVGTLRQWQPPQLGAAARERIIKELRQARRPPVELRRSVAPTAFAFGAAALAVATFALWPRHHFIAPAAQFTDAEVSYRPGAVASLEPATHTIRLEKGEVEVKGHAPLSVRAVTYVVKLTQAHAVFAADSIRVVSGEVFVYTLDGKELAKLTAGQGWPPKVILAAAPASGDLPQAPAPVVAAPAAPKVNVAAALERARSALAEGDAALARRHVRQALSGSPSMHDRAEAELFTAESYLVEKDSARAVAQYRRVAGSFAHLPEGEAAAFAAAQVLSESGDDDASRAAFRDYLSRYPEGRFAREARDRLKE